MKVVVSRINNFTPIDNEGLVEGSYYIDQCGNLVQLPKYVKPTQVYTPYIATVDLQDMNDVCTMHISEIEDMIVKLKTNLPNITDHDLQIKYAGYIEALNYIVTHNSYIDPWNDYLKEHFE